MAVIIGIDEAGYGPRLGPLVISAAALKFPSHSLPASMSLWSSLSSAVKDKPRRGDDRLTIADSKLLWRGGKGLEHLERSCLSFIFASDGQATNFQDLLEHISVQGAVSDTAAPWERPEAIGLPLAADDDKIREGAARLKAAAASLGASCAGLYVNLATPSRFNRLLHATGNKADALFELTTEVIKHLLGKFDDESILMMMDKQGGRRHYGPLLSRAFRGMWIEVQKESAAESRYLLTGSKKSKIAGQQVRLVIFQDGEQKSLLVALASMAAKYVRELFMRQLNAFFSQHLPALRPTAGYPADAERFLANIAPMREALGIADEVLIRSR